MFKNLFKKHFPLFCILITSFSRPLTHEQLKDNWEKSFNEKIYGAQDFPPYKNFLSKSLKEEDKKMLVRNCKSTKILIPSGFKQLVQDCIAKWKSGSNKKLAEYLNKVVPTGSDTEIDNYIISLVRRRPLAFLTSSDSYLTADGASGENFTEQTDAKDYSKYMCYEELELSPYVNLIADTTNINNGDRYNRGTPAANPESFEKDGVIIAAVGARYEVPGKMEYKHSVTTKESASQRADLLKQFLPFWFGDNVPLMKFNEEEKFSFEGKELCDRYLKFDSAQYLDAQIYFAIMKKRYETIFFGAAEKAKKMNKAVFIHLVGLGLGVWAITGLKQQMTDLQAAAAKEVLFEHPEIANHIYCADLSYFYNPSEKNEPTEEPKGLWTNKKPVETLDTHEVVRTTSTRNPWAKLTENELGEMPRDRVLLVADFAWDGGSFVGNEFWQRLFTASGDPAAACAGDIAITMNPLVNTEMLNTDRLQEVKLEKKKAKIASSAAQPLAKPQQRVSTEPSIHQRPLAQTSSDQENRIQNIVKNYKNTFLDHENEVAEKAADNYLRNPQNLILNCESARVFVPGGFRDFADKVIDQFANDVIENFSDKVKKELSKEHLLDFYKRNQHIFIRQLLLNRPVAIEDLTYNQKSVFSLFDAQTENSRQKPVSSLENYKKEYTRKYKNLLNPYLTLVSACTNINDGARVDPVTEKFVKHGLAIAAHGAYLKDPGVMEYDYLIGTAEELSNRRNNHPEIQHLVNFCCSGINLNLNFDETAKFKLPVKKDGVPDEVRTLQRYIEIKNLDKYFDAQLYYYMMKKRYEAIFLAAAQRAFFEDKSAYINLSGLGLGFWKVCYEQELLQVLAAMNALKDRDLYTIYKVNFAYLENKDAKKEWNGSLHRAVLTSDNRNPWQELTDEQRKKSDGKTLDPSKILVVSVFPADPRTYVGNRYWRQAKYPADSNDFAAALCSDIAVTMNPSANPFLQTPPIVEARDRHADTAWSIENKPKSQPSQHPKPHQTNQILSQHQQPQKQFALQVPEQNERFQQQMAVINTQLFQTPMPMSQSQVFSSQNTQPVKPGIDYRNVDIDKPFLKPGSTNPVFTSYKKTGADQKRLKMTSVIEKMKKLFESISFAFSKQR